MDLNTELYLDILGLDHGFDLDVMEQTIIDDVMTEISVNTTFPGEVIPFEPLNTVKQSKPPLQNAIEAADVGSLLEQFEEVSQTLNTADPGVTATHLQLKLHSERKPNEITDKNGNLDKKKSTSEVLQKLKSLQKPKSAVMLPMMVPAKRGRGRAMTRGHPVAMPANCTPRRLQRVMMQNAELKDSLALLIEQKAKENKKNVQEQVSEHISKLEVITEKVKVNIENSVTKNSSEEPVNSDHDYFYKSVSDKKFGNCDNLNNQGNPSASVDKEEGELIEDDELEHEHQTSKHRDKYVEEPSQFFDKLPSYYTALSIPRKQIKKTASCAYGRGGITSHDYIERAISPVHDTATYNKLPDYCSSFTNSTKYDTITDSNRSKASSGYSSRSQSPASQSRYSGSRSRSLSQSPSRSLSRSRSQSHHRKRQTSFSSCSGYTSSTSCCSSCSRSSSISSNCSSDDSCSTCVSRSPSVSRSSSRSSERAWQRERKFRSQRTHRSRSGRSRGRSIRRSRSYSNSRSCSRNYRSRSRSCSNGRRSRDPSQEHRREERKKMREEEKQQQMKERRIVYVGGLPNSYTRHELRSRFERFGEIENVQLHFREHGDNYGFVTFIYTCDAFAAIEKGNRVAGLETFDLCFGGRRQFCDVEYADLDGNKEVEEEYETKPQKTASCDFDELLRLAKAKIKK